MITILLLVICAPAFLLAASLVAISGRGPILFRSRRLGWGKKPFDMLKFRTLKVGAESILGEHLLTIDRAIELNVEHRFGRFLRETRLDELPQLFNVLKGDMALIGPRPVRPEVYEREVAEISDYDQRFMVVPGLVGYSQLFTPHSTSKRLRSHIDNRYTALQVSYFVDLRLLAMVGSAVPGRAAWIIGRSLQSFVQRTVRGRFRDRRRRTRMVPARSTIRLPELVGERTCGVLVDINDEAMLLHTDLELPVEESIAIKMETRVFECSRWRRRTRTCYCHGEVQRQSRRENKDLPFATVVAYTPDTPLNAYRIAKYLLHEGLL